LNRKTAVWWLEGEGGCAGDSADVSTSVRDRIKRPPVASGKDLHLHLNLNSRAALAARGGGAAAEDVGLDPRHIPFQGTGSDRERHLEKLRFRRMLDGITRCRLTS